MRKQHNLSCVLKEKYVPSTLFLEYFVNNKKTWNI